MPFQYAQTTCLTAVLSPDVFLWSVFTLYCSTCAFVTCVLIKRVQSPGPDPYDNLAIFFKISTGFWIFGFVISTPVQSWLDHLRRSILNKLTALPRFRSWISLVRFVTRKEGRERGREWVKRGKEEIKVRTITVFRRTDQRQCPHSSIHGYETRHNKLCLSHANTRFGQRILRYKGSQLWNRLPSNLTNSTASQPYRKKN